MSQRVATEIKQQSSPRRSVVFASYNVHGCIGTDGKKDVARVARVLRQLRADVIALQEVNCPGDTLPDDQGALLAELSGFTPIWAPTRPHESATFGNALFSAWPIERSEVIDLSYPHCEPRLALDAHLVVAGTKIRVFATHLGLRPGERRYQVQKILQSVEHEDDQLTVLLGDINEWFVPGRPLRWLHAKFGWGPAVRSFPSYFPLLSLDRIWVHPPQGLLRMWTVTQGDSRKASDHLPVLAEVALDPMAAAFDRNRWPSRL